MDDLHCLLSGPVEPTRSGALDGVTFAVKDLISIEGHVSSFGHPHWRATHEPAVADASVVARTRANGGRIIGMTKMEQLAYSLIGNLGEGPAPVNTFDNAAFCGGSSSGSAAAVAGGLASVGIGTDTAGSIRVPAAACGLLGIRPTHGRIDDSGVIPFAPSFDVVGLLAQSSALMKVVFETLTTRRSPTIPIVRVLLPADLGSDQDTRESVAAARLARRVESLTGAEVVPVAFGSFVDDSVGSLFARIQGREIWANHGEWVSSNIEHLAGEVQTRLRVCESRASDPDEVQEQDRRLCDAYRSELHDLIQPGTVAILPIRPRRGPLRAWSAEQLGEFRAECFRLMAPSSLSGLPQMAVPTTWGGEYVSLGIIGAANSDEMLIELAGEAISREHE
jgi:amidase